MAEYESFNEEETFRIAFEIGEKAELKQVYTLSGELGAGKTVFAKGFAAGLNINEHITSPTFSIMNVYEGRLNLYHFDMYRIEDVEELYNIGFEEFLYGNGVCLIEWPEMAGDAIPESAIKIEITKDYGKSNDYRLIKIYS